MKTILIIAALSLNMAFAQEETPSQAELRSQLQTIVGSGTTLTCLETKAEVDSPDEVSGFFENKVSFNVSLAPNDMYEFEYYVNFQNTQTNDKWYYLVAYDDFNGSPLGTLKVSETAEEKNYLHIFHGYRESRLKLTMKNGKATRLLIKTVSGGYVVHKVDCAL